MTDYELNKHARLTAKYLLEALKNDDELLDKIFPPKPMGIDEAAAFMSIPVGTIYQKISEIPHTKLGRRLIFTDRGLMRYMERKNGERRVMEITPFKNVI